MSGFITVHLRVNDAAAGKPTPVRLRISGQDGVFFAPFGRCSDFPLGRNEAVGGHLYLGGKKYAYIDGACEISLPTGVPLEFEISKGPEYEPIRESVTLGPGQMAVRFAIQRWIDLRSQGWFSADTRCHFLSPHDALLEAAAEDVAFVHLLATEHHTPSLDGHLYRTVPNLTGFSGHRAALETAEHAVIVNTFNAHPVLGRVGLLHSHRPVFPLSFGGSEETDDWSLCDWCDQCHRKGGFSVWCDAFRPESGLPGGEALIALLLGKIDALELDANERGQPFLPIWYRLLNAGVRVPLAGASGKDSNRHAIGSMRTYTYLRKEDRSLGNWVEQTRHGWSFVTNGPLIDLKTSPGFSDDPTNFFVEATARSAAPFERMELIVNGEIIADASPAGTPNSVTIQREMNMDGGWFAIRCRGGSKPSLYPFQTIFAHTSPIYFEPARRDAAAIAWLRQLVERTRDWFETEGCYKNEKRKAASRDFALAAESRLADLAEGK